MHITVSGRLGSGKSTYCKILAEKYPFEIYSTGTIQRGLAVKFGVSTLEMNRLMESDTKYDNMIDDEVVRISRETTDKNIIFDSRMAWHFAENSFRVFVVVDPGIAAERVFKNPRGAEETYADADEAKRMLLARGKAENERFRQIYGVDNLDYGNYDFVIDSSYAAPEIICEKIYVAYKNFKDKNAGTDILISPKSAYPAAPVESLGGAETDGYAEDLRNGRELEPIEIYIYGGCFYVADGHRRLLAALRQKTDFMRAVIVKRKTENEKSPYADTGEGIKILRGYEEDAGFTYSGRPDFY